MNKEEKIKNYYKQKYINSKVKSKYIEFKKSNRFDIIDRIIDNLRRRAYLYIKKVDITNIQLIGCSKDELRVHIEKKFKNDMNFDNYGFWEIDHIRPLSSFNLYKENEIIECFNYMNLQPLWKSENRSKSDKYCERSEPHA